MISDGQAFSVFLINLDRSSDRLHDMQSQLALLGLTFERVPGILGAALPAALREFFCDSAGRVVSPLKAGEIGCHAAHLSIYRRLANGLSDSIGLVLEDDCVLPDDLAEIVSSALSAVPPDWDIIRLSNPPKRAYVPLAALQRGRQLVRYSKVPNYTQAYLLNVSAAAKLSRPGLRVHALDEYLRRPWLHDLRTYGIVPAPVEPRRIVSNIDAIEPRDADGRRNSIARSLLRSDLANLPYRIGFNIRSLGVKRWAACAAINFADNFARRINRRTIIHRAAARLAGRPSERSPRVPRS